MSARRCPLCLEKLQNGECNSCGYKLPDEENISTEYDYEPDAYPQQETFVREITPAVQTEEIYPGREEMKFEVRDSSGAVLSNDKVNLSKKSAAGKTADNKQASNPYAGYTPLDLSANGKASSGNSETDSVMSFVKKYWWVILLSFIFPPAGIVLYLIMKNELGQYKHYKLVLIAIVLGFFF